MPLVALNDTITLAMSVKDRHASAKWFNELFGFEVLYHADEAGWSEIQTMTRGITIGLGEHTQPAPGNCVPVFGTSDLVDARRRLENAGVRFDGPNDVVEGMVQTATFYDLDGNAFMLAEDLTTGA